MPTQLRHALRVLLGSMELELQHHAMTAHLEKRIWTPIQRRRAQNVLLVTTQRKHLLCALNASLVGPTQTAMPRPHALIVPQEHTQ